MATKKGYKQTDVGQIPSEWDVKSINEIFTIYPTASYSRAELSADDEYLYLHYGDIHTKFHHHLNVNSKYLPYISPTKASRYKSLKSGDLIMVDTSEDYSGVGKSVEIINENNRKIIAGLHTFLLRDEKCKLIDGYKGYVAYHPVVKRQLELLSTGIKVYSLIKANLKDVIIPIPSNQEQKNIAESLINIDKLIFGISNKIEKKRLIKQGVMQRMFGSRSSNQMEEVSLGSIASMHSGGTPLSTEKKYYDGGTIPFLTISDISTSGTHIHTTKQNITACGLDNSTAKIFPKGTIMYAMYASIGKCAIADIELACSQAILGITPNSKMVHSSYLYYYLTYIAEQASNMGQTGTQSNLNKEIVQNIKIKIPSSLSAQKEIASTLTDIDSEIAILESNKEKYENLRQAVMEQLLTGQIRLVGKTTKQKSVTAKKEPKKATKHSNEFEEATVITFLVNKFATTQYPLSRFRCTKYSYLLHRKHQQVADGFGKYAAGPYKPTNRYKGPENIAIKNNYISKVPNPKSGKDAFLPSENKDAGIQYFNKYYGDEIGQWIEQFRYYKGGYLEVLTTIDMAMNDLKEASKSITVSSLREYIASIPEWRHKLEYDYFTDENIEKAIAESRTLFG